MQICKVLFVIKLTLVLILSFVIIRTVIIPQKPAELFQPASAIGTENQTAGGIVNLVEVPAEDYSDLLDQNVFDVTDISDDQKESTRIEKVSDVVVMAGQELGLELIGTVCGSRVVSRAIIKNTGNKQVGLYRTGQNVADARVQSIQENAVILLHNGQRKMLALSRYGADVSNAQMLLSSVNNKADTVAGSDLPANQSLNGISTKVVLIEAILNKATIEPYIVNDQAEGLRITNLDEIPMARTFGLQEGDVIRQVNGHRLTGKQQAFQILKKARSQDTMSFELLSNGRTRMMSFDLH